MPSGKFRYLILITLGILLVTSFIIYWPASRASAQCGSQASSCKNCHEVQGQDPVNADGTGWHQSHAFGDFCYLCHAGNNQAMDKNGAHLGMVPPLSDVQAACLSCHPDDLMERAQVYASTLGVQVSAAGESAAKPESPPASPAGSGEASAPAPPTVPQAPAALPAAANLIDYNRQYDETVLGKRTFNWGDITLGVLVAMTALGGSLFVYWNERRLRGLPLRIAPARIQAANVAPAELSDFPQEVVSLLPGIARLNPAGLYALKRLLEDPEQASELLLSLSRLDPELVRRVRGLDREARALLLALSGD